MTAIKGDKTLVKLTKHFDVHPNQISEWKQQLIESAAEVFGGTDRGEKHGQNWVANMVIGRTAANLCEIVGRPVLMIP